MRSRQALEQSSLLRDFISTSMEELLIHSGPLTTCSRYFSKSKRNAAGESKASATSHGMNMRVDMPACGGRCSAEALKPSALLRWIVRGECQPPSAHDSTASAG